MEKLLHRIARQLDAIDEASLMDLWSKYGTITERFEPTKRWEEAALIFSMIQAKHLKNQLFNYHWSRQVRADQDAGDPQASASVAMPFGFLEGPAAPPPARAADGEVEKQQSEKKCRILKFVQLYPQGSGNGKGEDGGDKPASPPQKGK